MKALTKLKDDARKHEQKEEWDKAVQLYLEVIRTAEESEGDSELPLYNRVGDLFVRMGRPGDAVSYYEKAADRYAEAGLFNNAIALCNKALRYLPNRTELLRKLGQFSASQGFITEARRWYLEYAERKLKEGALDEAFQALDDFASVHEDADVREMLGRQLLAHARRDHALQELKKAYELRVAAGQSDASVRLMDEILTIDPGAFSESGTPAPAEEAPAQPQAFDVPQIDSWAPPTPAEPAPIEPVDLGLETPADAFGLEAPADAFGLQAPAGSGFETPADATGLELPAEASGTEPPADVPGPESAIDSGLIDLSSLQLPGMDAPEPATAEPVALDGIDVSAPEPVIESFDVPLVDLDAALADINAEIAGAANEPADAGMAPIDLDSIDLSGGNDLDAGLVDISATGLDQPAADVDDALIEPLPLIDPGVGDEGDPAELPLLDDGFGFESAAAGLEEATLEESFDSEPAEPLPLLGDENEEPLPAAEPPAEVAFDGPVVEPGPAEAEPEFEIETPQPGGDTAFEEAPDAFSAQLAGVEVPEAVSEPGADETTFDPATVQPIEESASFDHASPEDARADEFGFEPVDDVESGEFEDVAEEADNEPESIEAPGYDFEMPEAAEPVPNDLNAEREVPTDDTGFDFDFEEGEDDLEPDWTETFAAAREFAERGETAAAIEELLILHEDLAASDMYQEGLEVIEELIRLEPGSVGHLQQRVEYATKVGDSPTLLRAYLDLAERLARSGSTVKANAIYQRVLDIDPTNAIARNAVYTPPAPVQTNSDGYVDLFSLLTEEEESGTRFVVEEKPPTGDEERDFADMLSQFKQKLADHVPFDDSSSHYDLGLAFKEMGLFDEAIAEFQIALKGGQDRLKIYEELGQCFLAKQQYNVAITILNRALGMGADEGDLVGVYYHIGRSYEEMGQRADAKTAYERVVGVDITFKDAAERLNRL